MTYVTTDKLANHITRRVTRRVTSARDYHLIKVWKQQVSFFKYVYSKAAAPYIYFSQFTKASYSYHCNSVTLLCSQIVHSLASYTDGSRSSNRVSL